MADYQSDRTGASIDEVLDTADNMLTAASAGSVTAYTDKGNGVTAADAAVAIKGAKDGSIGRAVTSVISDALDTPNYAGFFNIAGSTLNAPSSGSLIRGSKDTNYSGELLIGAPPNAVTTPTSAWIRARSIGGVYGEFQELYHTGNTGFLQFNKDESIVAGNSMSIGNGLTPQITTSQAGTALARHYAFRNGNGTVGTISTSGVSTSYNTSSDNRLKLDVGKPTDEEVNQKFNDIYDTFTCFNWKTDENGQKAWGFFAHDVLDRGLDFASEGEGPRELNIGDVYDTTPAVTEQRAILDEGGNETGEFETVEVTPAIEHKVTPAGIDQSKVVPYLVAKIEQQDRLIQALIAKVGGL